MTKRSLFVLLYLFFNVANAATPETFWSITMSGVIYAGYSPDSACQAAASRIGYTFTGVSVGTSTADCKGYKPPSLPSQAGNMFTVYRTICLSDKPYANLSTATCTGTPPPPPPPSCPKGDKTSEYYESIANGPPANAGFPYCASNGCGILVTYVGGCVGGGADGVSACLFKGEQTGTVCNAATANQQSTNWGAGKETKPASASGRVDMPATRADSDGSKCPTGSVQGGVDKSGIPICIGRGADPENPSTPPVTTKPPVTTTNSDGSTTTKQDVVKTNADGSTTTTTTTTTKGADGSITVSGESNTSKTPGGSDGKADTGDKANLCADNPTLAICQNSTVSGACEEVTCKGDAIQCATLRAAAAMECRDKKDREDLSKSDIKKLGDSIIAGSDPMQGTIDGVLKGTSVDLSKPNLDQGGFIGGGSCLPDKSFTVMGRAVTVSFSAVCSNIQPLRYVIMACAFILVYLMVARSVIGS